VSPVRALSGFGYDWKQVVFGRRMMTSLPQSLSRRVGRPWTPSGAARIASEGGD